MNTVPAPAPRGRGRPKGSKSRPKTAKPPPERTMFSLPRIGGKEAWAHLVRTYGGVDRVAADLKMTIDLVNLYQTAQDPPYAVLIALWWQGPHGFDQAFSETHWTHMLNFAAKRNAEERVQLLEHKLTSIANALGHDHPALLALEPKP